MSPSLPPGARLGRYEIRSQLGAGGMGEVYLAEDTSELERTVALKILPAGLASNQQRMQRFIQEAKTVSALNHPNIMTIHEIGQAQGMRSIVTEYIDGVTLRETVNQSFRHLGRCDNKPALRLYPQRSAVRGFVAPHGAEELSLEAGYCPPLVRVAHLWRAIAGL